ncbi:hypothetical protein D3C78_1134540 [compost metagenome]
MPGAAGRIQHRQRLGVESSAVLAHAHLDQRIELGLDIRGLLGRLDVVRHLRLEARAGVGHQPEAAEAVLHQVLDDPVGGE